MRELTYSEAINEALREEMFRDSTVYIIGEDVGIYAMAHKASAGLYAEFGGDRVIDTPIAEAMIVGTSVGAALAGMRPVADLGIADFMLDGMDVLVNYAARARYCSDGEVKVPIVIRASFGAGGEMDLNLEAWFMHVPGLKVVMPSTPYDAKGLLKSAIRDDNPVIFFDHGTLYRELKGLVPKEEFTIPLGVADIKREGDDVTIVATAKMVHEALAAAEDLAKESISLEVVDLRSIYPIDMTMVLNSVNKTGRLVIAHQAWKTGGIGAEISAVVAEEAFSSLKAPITRVAHPDVPTPAGYTLENVFYVGANEIINAVHELIKWG